MCPFLNSNVIIQYVLSVCDHCLTQVNKLHLIFVYRQQ